MRKVGSEKEMGYKHKGMEHESGLVAGIDRRIYQGIRLRKDGIVQENQVKNAVLRTLGITYEVENEAGEIEEHSIIQDIVNATIKEAIENPKMSNLRELAMLTGEMNANQNINVNVNNSPSKLFGDCVYDVEVIDAEIKER